MRFNIELDAFEGFCLGILALTGFLILEHGFSFYFIESLGWYNFRYCFRTITMLIMVSGILGCYHYVSHDILNSFFLGLFVFCYFDLIFLYHGWNYYSQTFGLTRDILILCMAIYGITWLPKLRKKPIRLNKVSVLSFILILPIELVIVTSWGTINPEFYLNQYSTLWNVFTDILFKGLPFLCVIWPSMLERNA